ncbi:MAG: hypothetical protein LAQ69_10200 [Acidobacteriia bacterium]|nr:hypothetical protein [Terriglobia bacterium]
MDCNYRPQVKGADDAIWRRMRLVPFDVSMEESNPEYDKNLGEKLRAVAEGILAWTARGSGSGVLSSPLPETAIQ